MLDTPPFHALMIILDDFVTSLELELAAGGGAMDSRASSSTGSWPCTKKRPRSSPCWIPSPGRWSHYIDGNHCKGR